MLTLVSFIVRGKCGECPQNNNNNKIIANSLQTLLLLLFNHQDAATEQIEARRTMRPHIPHGQVFSSGFLRSCSIGHSAPCLSNGRRTLYTVARKRSTPRRNPLANSLLLCRGAKTKSTVKLKDLPQGGLKLEEPYEPDVNDAPQYPTVIQGVRNNMSKFKNCVLLTRVGNFYEACPFP